ncbi:ATP/GTP-binding protein [Streptomyces sp. NBC_01481]|uniref:GTP-binding protein n=1 Tax=Streptomyces sp. NBC_01481 TaxID=2975869 RepID=UPI0022576A1E|nr:ATP/GTP-binding protein [Streptomyces sp. NBC_01481]MCX4588057.1 ATP/GTP-binding protein [Streptomyces sp. NBC_01481]
MASAPSSFSEPTSSSGLHLPDSARELVKILVTGPFGVGKTTLIDSVSEIRPLHTEEQLTEASVASDDLAGVRDKTTTTVAIDFGRISLAGGIVLYLFGTPGQERFRSLWDEIAYKRRRRAGGRPGRIDAPVRRTSLVSRSPVQRGSPTGLDLQDDRGAVAPPRIYGLPVTRW